MKPRFAFLFVLPLVFLIIAGSQPSAAGTVNEANVPPVPLPVWRGEVAASGVYLINQGEPGMALDPDGRPHLVYGGNLLFHAWHDGAAWQVETVDPGGALAGPAIAIDDAGTITIVAYTAAGSQRGELTAYSRAPGGLWQTAPIPVPRISNYPVLALALDGAGRPHVLTTGSIADQTPLLIYAHTSAQGWVSETIELERFALGDLSLALDSHNQPVILYETDDDSNDGLGRDKVLYLVRRDVSGWSTTPIAHAEFIVDKSLALDTADRAHVVFTDLDPNQLVYLRQMSNGWQTRVEEVKSYSLSLALDDADRPHIAYTNDNDDLVYATLGSGGWERTTIPMVGHGGWHNTLLLDETGAAHISTMQVRQNLYYATNRGGAWSAMPVAVEDVVGEKHALALDADDRPYLLYYHPFVGQLRWAAKDDDGWATSVVAGVGNVPLDALELATAFGPDGVARIAYVDGAANELVFGIRQGDAWLLEPITTAGRDLALAVGQDNRPQVILIQDNRLAYWTREAGAWQREWISPAGVFVFNAFLALDGQNRPHVIYTGDGVVMSATRRGKDDWPAEPLPVENVVGLALGSEGALSLLTLTLRDEGSRPPITYATLWLEEQVAGEWTQYEIFQDVYVGGGQVEPDDYRLHIGADGVRHVVSRYFSGWLRYDWRAADGEWSHEEMAGMVGRFALAVGSDGRPRVSRHEDNDLRLHTREILWLDQHALLPVVPGQP